MKLLNLSDDELRIIYAVQSLYQRLAKRPAGAKKGTG
ncbi:Uncharacterised protein [Moraxella lacunata]|uniref:Uncharacterized protein n=1 Tax=Moraxella lacunata TaxID=477 RepID=A0A378UEH8_MORLA|nr:Uncharacterised protein [Moraxella lacunata]